MTLREIVEKCSGLSVHEERCLNDEYGELVFYNGEIDEWKKILADIFGPAIKPAGVKPTEDHVHLTKEYGGVWVDQTLFKKEFDDYTVIAMFWPWGNNTHTTLKMALLSK